MKNINTNYDNYNFQAKLVDNLADSLFLLRQSISKAYQDRPGDYENALSDCILFVDNIIGMKLKYKEEDIMIIRLNLDIAKKFYERNDLSSGTSYLSKAYQKICSIIKLNDMMFPRLRKVTSFKDWAEQQL